MLAKLQYRSLIPSWDELKFSAWISFSCLLAIGVYQYLPINHSLWIVISATLLPISAIGHHKWIQSLNLIKWGICTAGLVIITLLVKGSLWGLLPWMFVSTLLLYVLPRYQYDSQSAPVIMVALMAMAQGIPGSSLPFSLAWHYGAAVLIGTTISLLVNIVLNFSQTNKKPNPLCQSRYLILRAIRIAIAVTLAVFIGRVFRFQNSAWVVFAVIFVSQVNLGSSIRKAWHRIMGTFLGMLAGIFLAHFLFDIYPISLILAVPLLFITFAMVNRSYVICIFMATLLITSLFFLMHYKGEGAGYFLLTRLGDTALGVIIGLLGEIFIFPRSLLMPLRKLFRDFWNDAADFLKLYSNHMKFSQSEYQEAQRLVDKMRADHKTVKEYLLDFRYEPYRLLSKRYHISTKLLSDSINLVKVFERFVHLEIDASDFQYRREILTVLVNELYKIAELPQKMTSTKIINMMDILEKNNKIMMQNKSMLKTHLEFEGIYQGLVVVLFDLLNKYRLALDTPQWRI